MDAEQYKLALILGKILQPQLKIDYNNLENFLNKINKIETTTENLTHYSQIFFNWIERCLIQFENNNFNVTIFKFLIDLTIILSKSTIKLTIINKFNCINRIINLLSKDNTNSLCISYIKLLNSLVTTNIGLNWLTSNKSWYNFFSMHINCTDEFLKECSIFYCELFFSLGLKHKSVLIVLSDILINSLYEILLKLNKNKYFEDSLFNEYSAYFKLMNFSDIYVSENSKRLKNVKSVLDMCNLLKFEECMSNVLIKSKTANFTLEASKSLIFYQFYKMATDTFQSNTHIHAKLNIENVISILKLNIDRGFLQNVIILTHYAIIFSKNMNITGKFKLLSFCDQPFQFEKQLLYYFQLPLVCMNFKILNVKYLKLIEEDALREDFVDKRFIGIHPMMLHLGYQFRSALEQQHCLKEIVKLTLKYILKTKYIYSQESIVVMFQFLVYMLSDLKKYLSTALQRNEYKDIYLGVIDILISFIKENNLTWNDCVETINVMDIAFDMLQLSDLPLELEVKGLDLVKVSICNYMSPNLALLVDSNDSEMSFMGSMIISKIHNRNLIIKQAALEVILIISTNAKSKYPFFQKVIKEGNIPELLLTLLQTNEVHNCKVIVLKCLQNICIIGEMWDILNSLNLKEILIKMLQETHEHTTQSEIVKLVSVIYTEEFFTEIEITELYKNMYFLGLSDSIGDVKLDVLSFWNAVIEKLLKDEGMIDNIFPEITFSKQLRKIITLNEKEIRKRLIKIMNTLSRINCLDVLNFCFQYEPNSEVVRRSKLISKRITKLLDEYNINFDNIEDEDTFTSEILKSPFNDVLNENDSDIDINLLLDMELSEDMKQLERNFNIDNITPKYFLEKLSAVTLKTSTTPKEEFNEFLNELLSVYLSIKVIL